MTPTKPPSMLAVLQEPAPEGTPVVTADDLAAGLDLILAALDARQRTGELHAEHVQATRNVLAEMLTATLHTIIKTGYMVPEPTMSGETPPDNPTTRHQTNSPA